MLPPFTYDALSMRVLFGDGMLKQLPGEVGRLGVRNALILSTPGRSKKAYELHGMLSSVSAGVFDQAAMHTPVSITGHALEAVNERQVDGLVSIGGGSTIGLGKAIALRTDLPHIAVPTTYAGSEMTPLLGETHDGKKVARRSLKVLPVTTIYDVSLTLSLPPKLAATSGLNAIAHAVEALYAENVNPVISLMAEEAIAALGASLAAIIAEPHDVTARTTAQYGAWLCGITLGSVAMGLHHKLCHILGGSFGLSHAETHAIVLPHVVAYNSEAAPEAMKRVARALGVSDPASGLFDLARSLGAPAALASIGMAEGDLDRAANLAVAQPYPNPREIEVLAIRALLENAFHGLRPRATDLSR
jgi:maleylacetate reductase